MMVLGSYVKGRHHHAYKLRKLRFMIANLIRSAGGVKRFLSLGLTSPKPLPKAA